MRGMQHKLDRNGIGIGLIMALAVFVGLFLDIHAVPLNVVNLDGLEGNPRMRADYGFYAADNQSSFKGDSYLDLVDSNVKPRSTNALQRSGCRYKATIYASGDNVPTEESCLFCHCKGSVVVCKLRVCPEVPDPPPQGCIVVKKANKCCSQLVCHDNQIRKLAREQRLSQENATETLPSSALQTLDKGNSCVHEGTIYAEGSAMRSSTLCEHCFCIHGKMKCSSPQCLIPLNGCKPRYRSYACCPTHYNCNQSNQTAILKTTPSFTQVPHFLKGCTVGGRYVAEGEAILPMQLMAENGNSIVGREISPCQTCFCLGGVVQCQRLGCNKPIDGCRPIIEDGHCCPDRYICDKQEEEVTTTSGGGDEFETTMVPTFVPYQETSTQVYEIRFEKVPLFKASKNDDLELILNNAPTNKVKEARISYTSVGGFSKNNREGVGDRGSREQRRKTQNQKRPEFLPRSFYEDDAREDTSLSFESSSGRSDEHSSVDTEGKSDASTSTFDGDEEFPTSETDPSVVTEISEIKSDSAVDTSTLPNNESEASTKNVEGTTTEHTSNQSNTKVVLYDDDEAEDILPLTLTNDLRLEPVPEISTILTPPEYVSSSTTPPPELSSSSTVTPTPTPKSSTSLTTLPPATPVGNLEFISFGMEDAFSPLNETQYEIYPGQAISLPLPTYDLAARQGSLLSAGPQHEESSKTGTPPHDNSNSRPISFTEPPINLPFQADPSEEFETVSLPPKLEAIQEPIVFKHDDFRNTIMDVPVQTSLYNNGYYGQSLIPDDTGKDVELVISQAELDKPVESPISTENIGIGEVIQETVPFYTTTTSTPVPPIPQISSKRPEQPLKAISSNQKFIPSFLPISQPTPTNPGRTYSKFGMQDSSNRQGYPNTGTVSQIAGEHEDRFFVPPPPSFGIPYNPPNLMNRKVPSLNEDPITRLRYNNPFNQHGIIDPTLIHPDDEDDEENNDNGSEELGSYESYFNSQSPISSSGTIRPLDGRPSNLSPSLFSNRQGVPQASKVSLSHPLQSSPQLNFTHGATAPIPMISSSGTKVSLSSKDKPSGVQGAKTKFVNSKPLRRPKPEEEQQIDSGDPLGFKPVVAFPFSIPQSPDKFSLGLKLSGCNIYGKMYGIGQVIHELSSICVQCKCTEVGVQCSELQC